MRIAMIGQKGIPAAQGGIERHVEEIGVRLAARGHEVVVYCRPYFTGADHRFYNGVRLVVLPSLASKHLDALSHSLLAAADALRRGIDILHFHAIGPGMLAGLARLAGRRVVVTVHGLDWQRAKWGPVAQRFLRVGEWASVRQAHRTIAVSKGIAAHLRERYGVRSTYIPNAPGLGTLRPPANLGRVGLVPRRYVLFVGRLVPEKGAHYAIEAWRRLDPPYTLAIVGQTTFCGDYEQALRRAESERVRFLGRVPDALLEELYTNAFACVQPSDVEGMSLALLEMMAYGQCVVASDIPGNAEVIGGAEDVGVLFRKGDAAGLAAAFAGLFARPEDAERIGRRAREYVAAQFNWDRIAAATEAVYASLEGAEPADARERVAGVR